MDGYSATTRIEGVRPRFAGGPGRTSAAWPEHEPAVFPGTGAFDATPDESATEPFDDWIGERWAAFRDAWSQTTFFLTDPNSWR